MIAGEERERTKAVQRERTITGAVVIRVSAFFPSSTIGQQMKKRHGIAHGSSRRTELMHSQTPET